MTSVVMFMSYAFPRLNEDRWVDISPREKVYWADRKESMQTAAWVEALAPSPNREQFALFGSTLCNCYTLFFRCFSSSIYSCLLPPLCCYRRFWHGWVCCGRGYDSVNVNSILVFIHASALPYRFWAVVHAYVLFDHAACCQWSTSLLVSSSSYPSFQLQSNPYIFHFPCSHFPFSFQCPTLPTVGWRTKNKKKTKENEWEKVSRKKKRFSRQDKKYRVLSFVLSLRIVYNCAILPLVILSTINTKKKLMRKARWCRGQSIAWTREAICPHYQIRSASA